MRMHLILLVSVAITRLQPSAVPQLPPAIRADLEKSGCRIPQSYGERKPHNAVRGHFIGTAQRDWAVLCSRNGTSAIFVYQTESPSERFEIAAQPDIKFVQEPMGFSRRLLVASPHQIRRYFQYVGDKAPTLSHDGVEDLFEDKASSVYYFARDRWYTWPGSD